jgi:hypothetical protein
VVVFNVETGSPIEVRMSFFYFKSIGVCFQEKKNRRGEGGWQQGGRFLVWLGTVGTFLLAWITFHFPFQPIIVCSFLLKSPRPHALSLTPSLNFFRVPISDHKDLNIILRNEDGWLGKNNLCVAHGKLVIYLKPRRKFHVVLISSSRIIRYRLVTNKKFKLPRTL